MEEKLIYTNSQGLSAEISHSSIFFLNKVNGLDAIKSTFYTSKGIKQDGVTIIAQSLDVRDISIEGTIVSDEQEETLGYRRELIKIFNPKLTGVLRYELDDFIKEIDCKIEMPPVFQHTEFNFKSFLIQLMCPDPLWKNAITTGEQITTWIGGWKFKFKLPFKFKTKGETKKNIFNSGHVETPIEVIFKGPATNPSIINQTTGEFIKINKVLTSDDTLYITTEFGNKKVEIEKNGARANAFNYIDLDSSFFWLQVGDNLIEYTTESLEPQSVEIRYKNRYLGV
ncbi:phage tail family protein [Clostridium swellfunianum]|uniref:phage tail family protein n=1 Tax=Clostridium swellfunianum TaxID=1367462 RepID=UPI00202F596F|nr:phage tail family protein [Clostridium swellfunianum]MCM0648628.1 phage tail family protein [Clostridium swellfunianum]